MAEKGSGCLGGVLLAVAAFWVVGKCSEAPAPTVNAAYAPPATSTYQVYDPPPSLERVPSPTPIEDRSSEEPASDPPRSGSDDYYTNSDGVTVHSPEYSPDGNVPSGATAQCRDGTYSFSLHHSGTCSHHGGVAQWLS